MPELKLEVKNLAAAEGLAGIPGIAQTWEHVVGHVNRVHSDQDLGILESGGVVKATIEITFARTSAGATEMHITHSAKMTQPGFAKAGCTAHKRAGQWQYLPPEGEQPELPNITGVTRLPKGQAN